MNACPAGRSRSKEGRGKKGTRLFTDSSLNVETKNERLVVKKRLGGGARQRPGGTTYPHDNLILGGLLGAAVGGVGLLVQSSQWQFPSWDWGEPLAPQQRVS